VGELDAAVRTAIERTQGYFLRRQHADGFWAGELESNASITGEYLFLLRLLGRDSCQREQAIAAQLLRWQTDGGWPLFHGGPPELNATIEAAVALQMAGVPDEHPALAKAVAVARQLGGVERARVFTRIWLALLGALPWDTVPAMPPELMFLPDSFPLNIYRFASWARGTIVPLLIVMDRQPRYAGPAPALDALWTDPNRRKRCLGHRPVAPAWRLANSALKWLEPLTRWRPTRRRALAAARRWLLGHQERDGGWGGIFPAMSNSTLALYLLDGNSPAVESGLAALEGFAIEDEGRFRMQSCVSPCWDTPWAMLALAESGLPAEHPALRRAADWLLSQQSDLRSDWSRRAPSVEPGGWSFEFANANYPDVDDTAVVVMALLRAGASSGPARRRRLVVCHDDLTW